MFDELCFWTLDHSSARFIHQHAVDAYAAQHVRQDSPSIVAAFALVGLYLAVERGLTGRQVQRVHVLLAQSSKRWPAFTPPASVGAITIADVVACVADGDREDALQRWCASTWSAWQPDHQRVRALVRALV